MNTNDATRASAETVPDLDEAATKLTRAKDLTELIFLAAEGLMRELPHAANAITAGCDEIDRTLKEVQAILEAVMKGGEA